MIILIYCFVIPCYASSQNEEEQPFSLNRNSSYASIEENVTDIKKSQNIHDLSDSQDIFVLKKDVREKKYDGQTPPFYQRSDTYYTDVTLEKMKLKWHFSLGYSGIYFYFETDVTTAKYRQPEKESRFDHSAFSADKEWVFI